MMVYLFLADGFETVEALAPYDIMKRAGVDVKSVSIKKDKRVVSAQGVAVEADLAINEIKGTTPEMVVLPGGMPGATNLEKSEEVRDCLAHTYAAGGYLAAICAAPYVLGVNGYLQGKEATCYPGFEDKLEGAKLSEKPVICDGKIITAAGMGVALEFGFEIVRMLKGYEVAERIKKAVIYTR
ncbi:MAG TPA: DJ-1/PfpI family protein [Clostridiales bacterium]|nr:DJ-1/PfpI family protein [Clostridiales bacterium]